MIDALSETALTLGRWTEASIVIKGTILVMVGLAAVRMTQRARASVRHLMLAATFGGLLTLPFALALVPEAVAIEVPLAALRHLPASPGARNDPTVAGVAAVRADGDRPVSSDGRRSLTTGELARWAWGTGALAILASLSAAWWQLSRIRRTGVPWLSGRELIRTLAADAGVQRPVDVLFHEAVAAPLTTGVLRPAILLPCDARHWAEPDMRRALVHELEHVRRGDWALQVLARITCAMYWFHPLVWIARRQLCLEAERACDDAVLVKGECTEYAEQLVQLAQRMSQAPPQPALAMAKRSDLSARVSAILDSAQRRGRAGAPSAVVALSAMVVAVIGIVPLRAVTAAPSRDASVDANVSTETSMSAEANASAGSTGSQSERRSGAVDKALYEAAKEGDIDAITKLLDAGANVDAAIDGDGSPLIGAARAGRLNAVRLLLDRGADLNMAVRGDGNPLIMAAREGHIDVVALLLDRGASIEHVALGDENALIQASGNGQLPVVTLLVARGADINARVWVPRSRNEGEWRTALSMARRAGHAAVVNFLVSAGARE